jgi:ferredoxin--NADP+ reductase
MRAAIVGSGPSGFYAADQLLRAGFEVDVLDALPTPFGLVRAGVAPDHPKIKSVTRIYDKIAQHPAFRFFGGVRVGADVAPAELRERYHAVVYAVGTARGTRLGIPGEELAGVHSATEFVAWYNGHPSRADHRFDLAAQRAVVIGNGNVAIDVARMLMLDPGELAPTDTADHAVAALAASAVREVVLVGRRGPAQAAFTNPELLELGELARADVVVDPVDARPDADSAAWLASAAAGKTARRNVEILAEYAARGATGRAHRVVLRFLRSPVEIVGDEHGRVSGVRLAVNRIQREADGTLRAVPTSVDELIPCGLVLASIGHRGEPLDGVPFDDRRGLIRNVDGRVVEPSGAPRRGEYAVGWVKRGPSGVIGTNKKCANDTVARIVEDRDAGRLDAAPRPGAASTETWLRERVGAVVGWPGWTAIDAHETAAGAPAGRPRIKLVRVAEMEAVASRASALAGVLAADHAAEAEM